MKLRIPHFSASADIAAPASAPPQPEVIRPDNPNQTLVYLTKGADGTIQQVAAQGDLSAPRIPQTPVVNYGSDMWQQKEGAPDLGQQQPEAPAAAPETPAPVEPPPAPNPNEGYILVQDPQTGQIVTRVKADPAVIANQMYNDKAYIRDLHRLIDQLQNGHAPAPQGAQVQTPPSAPPPPVSLHEKFLPLAQKAFGNVEGVDVSPIAQFVAEAVGQAVADVRAEYEPKFQQYDQTQQNAAIVSQIQSEFAEIQQYDPRFKMEDPGVQRMHQMFPNETPKQIHARLLQAEYIESKRNPAPQAPPSQTPAATTPPANGIHRPPADMFAAPNGSAAIANQWKAHPEVVAQVDMYKRTQATNRMPVTQDGIARVEAFAIQAIQSRAGNSQRQQEGVVNHGR